MRLFDLHCDTLFECDYTGQSLDKNTLHIDLQRGCRMEEWRQVMAVWTPDTLWGDVAWNRTRRMLELAHSQAVATPNKLTVIGSAADLSAVTPHQCGAILALESGAGLGGDLDHLPEAAARGVRMITLTWNGENEWGYGCGCDRSRGLKPFGRAGLAEMERLGIIPDVSHLNEAGFWEVITRTSRPVVASHSLSAAVHPHPRNLTDDQFLAIRERGGLVGLSLYADHLGGADFEQIERHLDHFLCLGGEDTVAFGGDLDGIDLPAAWKDIGVMEQIEEYLYRKNYEDSLLSRLFFGNCNDFFVKTLVAFDK